MDIRMKETGIIFKHSIEEIVKKRSSWRSYQPDVIEDDTMKIIDDYISKLPIPPFGAEARFKIVDADPSQGRVPGTYGIIKGARHFLVGVAKEKGKYLEDFGYQFEKIVLLATDLNLATCWIGGTLKHSIFAEKAGMEPGELIICISPVGYGTKKRMVYEKVLRMAGGVKNRKPWEDLFFLENFDTPLTLKDAGDYQIPLEMVRRAPSSSNKQPWQIIKNGYKYHFYLKREKRVWDFALKSDLQRVDMGIAMCHFELSAIDKGLKGLWEINDPVIKNLSEETEYITTWVAG